MNRIPENCETERELEDMIDAYDLSSVLETVARICYGKAEHLRGNWQDGVTAKHWERAGNAVNNLACKSSIVSVS